MDHTLGDVFLDRAQAALLASHTEEQYCTVIMHDTTTFLYTTYNTSYNTHKHPF